MSAREVDREALIGCLARHVEAKASHIGEEPPSPRGCAVLLSLDVLSAAVALGPFDVPHLGIEVRDVGGAS